MACLWPFFCIIIYRNNNKFTSLRLLQSTRVCILSMHAIRGVLTDREADLLLSYCSSTSSYAYFASCIIRI